MKGSRVFIVCIVAFFALMFVVQLNLPQKYSWKATFSSKDKNPFGCYVFDSVMRRSLPNGYDVTGKTLYQLSKDNDRRNILVVTDELRAGKTDVNAIKNIAAGGGKVMLVCGSCPYGIDTLLMKNFNVSFGGYTYFSMKSLQYKIKNNIEGLRDTIYWCGGGIYGEAIYPGYSMMMDDKLKTDTLKDIEMLSRSKRFGGMEDYEIVCDSVSGTVPSDTATWVCNAARCKVGKGEVIFVSTPLFFTNYGILDGRTPEYIFRLMSYIAGQPVVRTTAYMKTPDMEEAEASPLRFFLSKPPLRTALYLTLLLIALLMIFTARRRQRVIPVIEPPVNRSLEFVRLIGTLYFRQKDHAGIVRTKFMLFAEELRRLIMVDVTDHADDSHTFAVIARHTGIDAGEVARIVCDIRKVADREVDVTEYGLKLYIDNMNMIINKIK